MLKKLNYTLNIIMGSVIGVFAGHGIFVIWDYRTHPGLYDMQSAPWYTSILVYGAFTAAVLAVAIMAKLVIRWKSKR